MSQRELVSGLNIEFLSEEPYRYAYREIFIRGDYAFPSAVKAPLIMDCGANIGLATLYFKSIFPASRIIAFEPDPDTFSVLRRNVKVNNLLSVQMHNLALWSRPGIIPFFVSETLPGSLRMSAIGERCEGKRIGVPCDTLSRFINEPVHFLKMDIEGAEQEVMTELVCSGKVDLIEQMIVEYHHNLESGRNRFSYFLSLLDQCSMRYQIRAYLSPITQRDVFQDILVYAYR